MASLDLDKMMEKHRKEMEESTDKYAKIFSQKVMDNLKRNGAMSILLWESIFAHDGWWLLLRYIGKSPIKMSSKKYGNDFLHLYEAIQIEHTMREDGLHFNFNTPQNIQVIEITEKALERKEILSRCFEM